jgi:DNA-binding response OmpR family regulator
MAILVVEDEADLSDLLSFILRRAGHEVIPAFDGESALRIWWERKPELILLDLNLPRCSGWEVCKVIRRESATPIMIISGADSEEDVVRGLDLGAEDYVTKPFSPRLLQARIRTLLRRSSRALEGPNAATPIDVGDMSLHSDWRTASCGERSVNLSRLEHLVLVELALHVGQVVPHTDLIEKVWGYRHESGSNMIKGHIRNIRRKLTTIRCGASIRIIPGVGYILTRGELHPVSTS